MGEQNIRYNTDIPTEYYHKYREKIETKPGDFYYGKDSDMLSKTWIAMKRGAVIDKSTKVGFWSGVLLAIVGSSFKKMAEYGVFERSLVPRRERVFDFYRTGWMIDRPSQEGVDDADKNDAVKHYSP
ncbi:hypothetical protein ElyMa_001506400 [Elysia marginata]|uniref:Uncharacterized protein n=1 Tax=Elysia marginata TaxID=1093978 RepID=A0AAV4J769_9GAST|nr:hypothetical protein ElyMa_001506400 [Elysia marginata]